MNSQNRIKHVSFKDRMGEAITICLFHSLLLFLSFQSAGSGFYLSSLQSSTGNKHSSASAGTKGNAQKGIHLNILLEDATESDIDEEEDVKEVLGQLQKPQGFKRLCFFDFATEHNEYPQAQYVASPVPLYVMHHSWKSYLS